MVNRDVKRACMSGGQAIAVGGDVTEMVKLASRHVLGRRREAQSIKTKGWRAGPR
jgi:hypothetical protein